MDPGHKSWQFLPELYIFSCVFENTKIKRRVVTSPSIVANPTSAGQNRGMRVEVHEGIYVDSSHNLYFYVWLSVGLDGNFFPTINTII